MSKPPNLGKNSIAASYSTLNRFGEMKIISPPHLGEHTIRNQMGPRPSGCGTWWPDFGPTARDFNDGGKNHPTNTVFERAFKLPKGTGGCQHVYHTGFGRSDGSSLQQFRHPQPQTEALWSSTLIMPYKSGGRRKCGEDANWKCSLSAGARMPMFAKGPLLDEPDRHQVHPLNSGEEVNIHKSCKLENVAAGGTSSTAPLNALLLQNRSAPSLGLRDSQTMRRDMSFNAASSVNRLANSTLGGTIKVGTVKIDDARSEASSSCCPPSRSEKLPYWVASRTVASRDMDAAGHAGCLLKKCHSMGGLLDSAGSSRATSSIGRRG